jgi:hypothetical protein
MDLGARGREQPPDNTGNSDDPRPGLGQLSAGVRHAFEEVLARRRWRFGHLNERLGRARGERLRRLPGPGVAYGLDDVSDRGDHELGLLVLDVVAALLGDDVLAVWDKPGELVLELSPQAFIRSDQPRVGS